MFDEKKIGEIREGYRKWSDELEPKLGKRPERKGDFVNTS